MKFFLYQRSPLNVIEDGIREHEVVCYVSEQSRVVREYRWVMLYEKCDFLWRKLSVLRQRCKRCTLHACRMIVICTCENYQSHSSYGDFFSNDLFQTTWWGINRFSKFLNILFAYLRFDIKLTCINMKFSLNFRCHWWRKRTSANLHIL